VYQVRPLCDAYKEGQRGRIEVAACLTCFNLRPCFAAGKTYAQMVVPAILTRRDN